MAVYPLPPGEDKESFANSIMGLVNPMAVGIIPQVASKNVVLDALRELASKLNLAVSKKGHGYEPGIGAYEYSKGVFKNKKKLEEGKKQIKELMSEYFPGIKAAREGLHNIEEFEPVRRLYHPIKSVEGSLEHPEYAARFVPGADKILFSTGTKRIQPETQSRIMLHELFHKNLENAPKSVLADLERAGGSMRQEFAGMGPHNLTPQQLQYITKPEEILADASAQQLLKNLIGTPGKLNRRLQWGNYQTFPGSASDFINNVILGLGK